ncbi:MAG: cytochrome bc complex cytochrome b subunit [Proteobacteria bacterium]|nr:cytochrome bc complex cytochrome b subunit [Pseudomonadota bacterium]
MDSEKQKLLEWIDQRFPLTKVWREHLSQYYAPKNFNFWYVFGALALLVFVNQILTGIWLAMFYTPTAADAFASVEAIMRDINFGWLLRYMHAIGASAFFIVIYLHIFRSFLYGSHKRPRELLWLFGVGLYLLLLMESFFGYLLPWGQMSYWGAEVITSLFSAIPGIGNDLVLWVRGDYSVSDATLHRFFSLHVIAIPLLMILLVFLHIVSLHKVGSNNPDGIEIKERKNAQGIPLDGIPFHPYYTVKDLFGVGVFLIIFCGVLFFMPTMGGYFLESTNSVPANPLTTPTHIAPLWYLAPFYSILRAIPNKLLGVMAMASSIAFLFVLPWLDRSPVRSIRYRGLWSKIALTLFVVSFIGLCYLGTLPVSELRQWCARFFALIYFAFFLAMPFYTRYEKTKPLPDRVKK